MCGRKRPLYVVILNSVSRLVFPTKKSLPTTILCANDEEAMNATPSSLSEISHAFVCCSKTLWHGNDVIFTIEVYWMSRYRLSPFKWWQFWLKCISIALCWGLPVGKLKLAIRPRELRTYMNSGFVLLSLGMRLDKAHTWAQQTEAGNIKCWTYSLS